MDVSKNRGGPQNWMVKIRENPIRMDDLGGKQPYFWVDTHISLPSKKWEGGLPSLKLTFSPLTINGWKMRFLLGWPIFRGLC